MEPGSIDVTNATAAFAAIAANPPALRTFLACVGNGQAPSRLRAAAAMTDCRTILDVGCGPAVFFATLLEQRQHDAAGGGAWRYFGVDPVRELLELARGRGMFLDDSRRPGALRAAIEGERVARAAGLPFVVELGEPSTAPTSAMLVAGDPLEQLEQLGDASVDGVVVRHVLEHLHSPHALLAHAARVARRCLVVALSQETRTAGTPLLPLVTDRHLGALRYSHWRPTLLQTVAAEGLQLVEHRRGEADGLVVREELFTWHRGSRCREQHDA